VFGLPLLSEIATDRIGMRCSVEITTGRLNRAVLRGCGEQHAPEISRLTAVASGPERDVRLKDGHAIIQNALAGEGWHGVHWQIPLCKKRARWHNQAYRRSTFPRVGGYRISLSHTWSAAYPRMKGINA